jgi:hypothetical protein
MPSVAVDMAATDQTQLAPTGNRVATALIVTGVVSLLTLGTAFGLLALSTDAFWVAFSVGFGCALPIALGVVTLQTASDD